MTDNATILQHVPVGKKVGIAFSGGLDTSAALLEKVCKDVHIEPQLIPVENRSLPSGTNTADSARLDVATRGF